MNETYVTGTEGLLQIRGRELAATYVALEEYRTRKTGYAPKLGSRIGRTYAALRDGPQTGEQLYHSGNWMPMRKRRMPKNDFKAHLRWMVKEERLHVVV